MVDNEESESSMELHLTPLHGITQLRPSYEYLDRADVLKAKKETDGHSTEEEEEEEAQQVTVRFARGGPRGAAARGGAARNASSWRRLQKKLEEESWISNIRWRGKMTSEELKERLEKKMEPRDALKAEESDLSKPPTDYLKSLQPLGMEDKEKVAPAMPSNVLSLLELKDLSTSDALLALLTNAQVMRFTQILQLLPPQKTSTTAAEVLRLLQQIAVVIRGCWVVKSEILYPEKFCSRHSGVAASLLCRGRDYMLWKFTQSRNVIRKDIQSTTKLPADDILEMLNGVALMRHGHGWSFRLEQDVEFGNKYPDIIAKQNAFWDHKVKALVNQGLKINVHASSSVPDLHVKCRNRLNSEVSSSDDSDGGRRNSNSPRLPRSRKTSTNRASKSGPSSPASKSPQVTRKGSISKSKSNSLQSQPLSNTIRSLDFKKDAAPTSQAMEIEEINPQITNGNSTADPSNGADNPRELTPTRRACHPDFVKFVGEKLASEMVLRLSDIKRAFHFKVAESDPGSGLGQSGFNEKMVGSAVTEAGGVRMKMPWPKNSDYMEEPVYAWLKKEDGLDDLRQDLLKVFSESGKVTGKLLKARLEESWANLRNLDDSIEREETLPDDVLKQLKAEFCVTKSGVWYLKNTITA